MRKNSIAIISLAFLASCFMVSCSTEAFDTNQPVKGAKIVIPAQKMSTKAVDADGKATFLTSENVYIAKSGTIDANAIHPSAASASTTFAGTLAGTYSQGEMITVLYNTNASGVVDYSGQDGSIGSVKDAGYADNVEIVSYSGNVLTTTSATIENLQSIFKFTFYNGSISEDNKISGIRFVRIYSNSNKLVAAYDVINKTSTFGPITVSRDSDLADNYIYVALRFDANPSDVIRFEVVDKDDNVYLGTKTAPAAGFENGIFYNSSVTVTLTPASKMAFRGYEVSAGILERSKSGDADAIYSLTYGEMTRNHGTMNYALPDGCNPFEPAVYYNDIASRGKYYNTWTTLQNELGADGDNIDAASTKLSGWRFPTGGAGVSTDWGKILSGAPKSPITVNGATVTENAYALVAVKLESVNSYLVDAGTYYGLLLLRDGTTIPKDYLSVLGGKSYNDNKLTEAQFNDLIKLGCLFVSSSGRYYNKWLYLEDGYYWTSTNGDKTGEAKRFQFFDGLSSLFGSYSKSHEYVVKLVKPL